MGSASSPMPMEVVTLEYRRRLRRVYRGDSPTLIYGESEDATLYVLELEMLEAELRMMLDALEGGRKERKLAVRALRLRLDSLTRSREEG